MDDIMNDPKIKILANSLLGMAEVLELDVYDMIDEMEEANILPEPMRSYAIHYLEHF